MDDATTTTTPPFTVRRHCSHDNFESSVAINRNETALTASVQVRCASCKLPMRFPGADGHTIATLQLVP